MKIAVLEPLGIPAEKAEAYAEELRGMGHTVTLWPDRDPDPQALLKRTADNDIVVIANTPYPASIVEAAPNLKFVDIAFTGVDHVAVADCKKKGVTVSNAAGYSTPAVAELALGMTIGCLRYFPEGDAAVRNGGTNKGLAGTEIAGKTVGILGTGTIGLYTAKLFLAFGAKVIAYSRTKKPEAEALGIAYVTKEELFRTADIVSVHVPSNAETRHLVSKALIDSMKKTAVLVNTARGAVVDNEALAAALKEGRIAAAGIDVFDKEPPLDKDYCLMNCPRIVPMPHVGFLTKESMLRRAEIVFANIKAFLAGNPQNLC